MSTHHQQRENQDALLDKYMETVRELSVAREYVAGAEAIIAELEGRVEVLDRELAKCNDRAEWYQRQSQRNRATINRAKIRIAELETTNVDLRNEGQNVSGRFER